MHFFLEKLRVTQLFEKQTTELYPKPIELTAQSHSIFVNTVIFLASPTPSRGFLTSWVYSLFLPGKFTVFSYVYTQRSMHRSIHLLPKKGATKFPGQRNKTGRFILYFIIYYIILYYITLYYINYILYYIILYHIILYHIIYYITLYHIMLYYIIWYYIYIYIYSIILYYIILYHIT